MFLRLRKLVIVTALACGVFGIASVPVVHADTLDTNFSVINGPKTSTTSQGIIFAGICTAPANPDTGADDCPCRSEGNCTLNDVLQVFVNLSTFILGISGSCVLFVFVYGGFKWMLSRGDTKWVESGKAAMTGGAIGLAIIFGAYVAINFIVSGLTTAAGTTPTTGTLENTIKQGTGSGTDVFTTE